MAIESRPAADDLNWAERLATRPRSFGFHVALRRIDAGAPDAPRLGEGALPSDESIRLGQEPSHAFDAAALTSATQQDGALARLAVGFFGLWGPNGPLPAHLTELARDRMARAGDATMASFADVFHHRLLVLFHRAWAAGQPTVAMDRPDQDRFALYVGALMGQGLHATQNRGAVPDRAKLHYAPVYARSARGPEALRALLADYLGLPISVEEFVAEWLDLPREERWQLGRRAPATSLGGAVLGSRTWSRGHRFRLIVGPLSGAEYERLAPGSTAMLAIAALVRQYTNDEWAWDLVLVLRPGVTPGLRIGSSRVGGACISAGTNRKQVEVTMIVDPERQRLRRASTRTA